MKCDDMLQGFWERVAVRITEFLGRVLGILIFCLNMDKTARAAKSLRLVIVDLGQAIGLQRAG